MNGICSGRLCRWFVLTWLVFTAGAANPASGYVVTEQQEQAIKVGMSTADVQRILGHPMLAVQYRNARGPSWFYDVIGMVVPVPTLFEVAFDADGKVFSAREYPDLSRNTGP